MVEEYVNHAPLSSAIYKLTSVVETILKMCSRCSEEFFASTANEVLLSKLIESLSNPANPSTRSNSVTDGKSVRSVSVVQQVALKYLNSL